MKITERRLRQIIRSVIKESAFSDDLGTYMGPDPVQGLGPADPENNIEEYIDENGDKWRRNIATGEEWNVPKERKAADKWNEQFIDS